MVKLPKNIQDLMMSNAYKNTANPEYRNVHNLIDEYFQATYPGNVEYDETGRMLDAEAEQNYDGWTEGGEDYESDDEEMITVWVAGGGCDHCSDMDGAIIEPGEAQCPHPNCKCSEDTMTMSEYEGRYGGVDPKRQAAAERVKQETKDYEKEYGVDLREEKRERMEREEKAKRMPKYLEAGEGAVKLIKGGEGSVKENGLHVPYDDKTGKIIKDFNDAVGYPTIGHGHLIRNPDEFEKYKNGISDSNAWSLFQNDTKNAVDDVRRRIKVPLKQNEFDSLVSQAFNLGDGNFRDTGIPAAVNRGTPENELQKLFMGAIKSKDEVVPGLKNRRSVEWQHYIKK